MYRYPLYLHSFPTRRSSDLRISNGRSRLSSAAMKSLDSFSLGGTAPSRRVMRTARESRGPPRSTPLRGRHGDGRRSEEHTSELQSLRHLVCRLLLEKKKSK